MGNLQALLEKSKIVFPRPLGETQMEYFFEYLANNFIEINYKTETNGLMSKRNFDSIKKLSKLW